MTGFIVIYMIKALHLGDAIRLSLRGAKKKPPEGGFSIQG